MTTTRRILALLLTIALVLSFALPVLGQERKPQFLLAEAPLDQQAEPQRITTQAAAVKKQSPTREEIRAKWDQVTYAATVYVEEPSITAPYAAGKLTEDFLESGLTYLNYVRFVAGLPEVILDDTLNETAQHGAVLLAAVDTLTHYPPQPADMADTFYNRGYQATTSSNISARWGFSDSTTMLKSAIQGCMDDSSSLSNLSSVGHRRWLLNPTLSKVGFGYAVSETDWHYIDTYVFDRSGAGCDYDFISWPAAGNQPSNVFGATAPWSVTLNPKLYKKPALNGLVVTMTREADGKQWILDASTGGPGNDAAAPYLTVENSGYGVSNCIIFYPGNMEAYTLEGLYHVSITGLSYTDGTAAELNYDVDFFDVKKVSCDHSYKSVVTAPTCAEQGYTTYTCTKCGHSYVGNYTDPVAHSYEDGQCKWCGKVESYVKWSSISTSLGGNIAMNFYVELSKDLVENPDAFICFEFADRTRYVPLSEGKPSEKNGVTVYQFSCPITSKNMTDEITAQVYHGSGAVGEPKTMSVDTYCTWVIANFKDEKTVNLMKAMLNYGASAQMLFDYRTDDLANATLAAEDKVFGVVDASAFIHSRTGTEDGIEPTSYTLLLDSETTVRCYFKLTGDKPIEDYTFTVDGVEVQPTYKDGKYYIERTGISAHRLDDMHVFTCGGITITYGGLSYVNQVMTYYTSGTTFDMASALYAYSMAAEAYIG